MKRFLILFTLAFWGTSSALAGPESSDYSCNLAQALTLGRNRFEAGTRVRVLGTKRYTDGLQGAAMMVPIEIDGQEFTIRESTIEEICW